MKRCANICNLYYDTEVEYIALRARYVEKRKRVQISGRSAGVFLQ